MTSWRPAAERKEALCAAEAQIKLDPESIGLRFERACLLNEMGRNEDAKLAYLDVLTRCPGHVGALNNLGTLLYLTGYRTAARSAYTEAIRQHPDQPMAHVNLGNLFLEAGELVAAREHYEAALAIDTQFAAAHQGLGNLLAELGQEENAAQHQRLGHWDRRPTELLYRGETEPVSLLLLASGRRGDVRSAICWTTKSSGPSSCCRMFMIRTRRFPSIRWCSMRSATPTFRSRRWTGPLRSWSARLLR